MIDDRTLLFASPDGTLLMQPPGPPPDDCSKTGMDARLQPWFTSTTRERPVEVVVVLDVLSRPPLISADSIDDLKQGVVAVLRSLTNQDRVGDVASFVVFYLVHCYKFQLTKCDRCMHIEYGSFHVKSTRKMDTHHRFC